MPASGGDIGFTKIVGEVGWYIPIFKWMVGFIHGKAGYVFENPEKALPDDELFYLGGINSVRGFDWREIRLVDENGASVGGMQQLQANLELQFPLMKSAGLLGVLFFDTGQVFDEDAYFLDLVLDEDGLYEYRLTGADFDLSRMRKTIGVGVRWNSPMGPIRIEYGYILDQKDTDNTTGQWEFTMGSAF